MQIILKQPAKPSVSFKTSTCYHYHLITCHKNKNMTSAHSKQNGNKQKKSHNRFVFSFEKLVVFFVCLFGLFCHYTFRICILCLFVIHNMNLNTIMMYYICNKRKYEIIRKKEDFYLWTFCFQSIRFDLFRVVRWENICNGTLTYKVFLLCKNKAAFTKNLKKLQKFFFTEDFSRIERVFETLSNIREIAILIL